MTSLALSVALLAACTSTPATAAVIVHNASSESINSVTIAVSDNTIATSTMKAGESVNLPIRIARESGYHIVARFESGREVVRDVGYVAPGYTSIDRLDIMSDEIRISSK